MGNRNFINIVSIVFFVLFTSFLVHASHIFAQQFTSSSFTVESPVLDAGGFASSTSFSLQSVISQISTGTSSATSFGVNAGFLYFPFVTTPVPSATPGDAQVALSWTAATGFLGWSVGGYSVGQSTVSGGPYSYASVGAVLSSTRTGLTNGTAYYFVIIAKDSFNNHIATSTETFATPVAAAPPPPPPPSGGGGGGGILSPSGGTVTLSGRAYPRSMVTVLKDAQVATTVIAGSDGTFQTGLSNLSTGNYVFSVYSEDRDGRRSNPVSFLTSVTQGSTTNITGIFLAPTIAVDKSEVRRGDDIAIFGQTAPQADVVISVNSEEEFFSRTTSDRDGIYLYNFDTSVLEYGSHGTRSKSSVNNQEVSPFSFVAKFEVGTKNVLAGAVKKCPAKGDVNSDCRVNLVDFSITAYWYKRTLTSQFTETEKTKLSGDGKVNIVDFSIMAYYWTG